MIDVILEQLKSLRLNGMLNNIQEILSESNKKLWNKY